MQDLRDAYRTKLLVTFLFAGLASFLVALNVWLATRPDPDGTSALLLQVAMGAGVDIGVIAGGLAIIQHRVDVRSLEQAEASKRYEADQLYNTRTTQLAALLDLTGTLYAQDVDRVVFDVLGSLEGWEREDPGSVDHARLQQASDALKWLAERGLTPAFGNALRIAARRVRRVRKGLPGDDQASVGRDLKRLEVAVPRAALSALDSASAFTIAAADHMIWVPGHRPDLVESLRAAVVAAHSRQAESRSALLAFEEAAGLYDPDRPYADPDRPFAHRDHHLDKQHGLLERAVELAEGFAELTATLITLREVFGKLEDRPDSVTVGQSLTELLPVGIDLDHVHYQRSSSEDERAPGEARR